MPSSKRSSHRQRIPVKKSLDSTLFKPSNPPYVETLNKQRVNYLLAMVNRAPITSVLHQLEYHRQELSKPAFRILLLLLTAELNSTTCNRFVNKQIVRATKRRIPKSNLKWQISSRKGIDQCCRIILYYIVSVINKYKIPSTENLWTEILGNSFTQNQQFYEYLYKNKINLPNKTCKLFSKTLSSFYSLQTSAVKVKLIELGFIFDGIITAATPIKDFERIFFLLKQREKSNGKVVQPEQFLLSIDTPEKLSLYLSYFPDYDINQVHKVNRFNALEQLINMKPYFYLPPVGTSTSYFPIRSDRFRFTYDTLSPLPILQFNSHPNEIVKYRALRIINLLQQLIRCGARLSTPVLSYLTSYEAYTDRFFATSLGIYVLIDLYMNDLYPSKRSSENDYDFVLFILKYIKRFHPEFQDLILHRLTLSYSIIHKPEFITEQRKYEDEQIQGINDKLFQRSLKLKEWCRLKIKDHYSQNHIKKFDLSKSLISYCLFNVFEPNYPKQCCKAQRKHNAKRIMHVSSANITLVAESPDDDNNLDDNGSDF